MNSILNLVVPSSTTNKKTEFITTEVDENDNLFGERTPQKRLETDPDAAREDLKTLLRAQDDESLNSMEDGRKSKLEFQKLQIIDTSTAIVAFIGAFITIMAVLLRSYHSFQNNSSMIWSLIRRTTISW